MIRGVVLGMKEAIPRNTPATIAANPHKRITFVLSTFDLFPASFKCSTGFRNY